MADALVLQEQLLCQLERLNQNLERLNQKPAFTTAEVQELETMADFRSNLKDQATAALLRVQKKSGKAAKKQQIRKI